MKPEKLIPLIAAALAAVTVAHAADASKNCGCSCCEGEEVCCCHQSANSDEAPHESAIRAALMTRFDRPGAPLSIEPVTIESDYAIAGWSQAGTGGRVLLRKQGDKWTPILCAGPDLKQTATLTEAGVSTPVAQSLLAKLSATEARLPRALAGKLDAFPRIVPIPPENP